MSQTDAEVVRDMWEAFLRGDVESALAAFAEDVEWDGTNLPDGTVSQGREAVLDHVTKWAEMWETWNVELEEIVDAGGGQVILFIREQGRTRTGLEANERHSELYTVLDGRITSRRGFSDADQALDEVRKGLVSPDAPTS